MQIYINKNSQQLGPFAKNQVLEMLRNGKLSPNDLGIRQGKTNWQPLSQMFPNQLLNNAIPNKFNGGLKFVFFVLAGFAGVLLVGIIGFALFITSQKRDVDYTSNLDNATNTILTKTNSATEAARQEENRRKLSFKKTELLNHTFPLKTSTSQIIKGKVHIVEENEAKDKLYEDNSEFEFAPTRKADSFAEIETLIQIICKKGGVIGSYEKGAKGYANVCQVTVNDFKEKVAIAQKTIINSNRQEFIAESKFSKGIYLNPRPFNEIKRFLVAFAVDKVLEKDDKELGRVQTTTKLDSNAKLNGKIAVVSKYAFLENYPNYHYETFNLPTNKIASNLEEIASLIKVDCQNGSRIGTREKTTFFSNKCVVSLIDFKTLTVFAQRIIENKVITDETGNPNNPVSYPVNLPKKEIEEYLKVMLN